MGEPSVCDINETIGKRIRFRRRQLQLTQPQLAQACGVSFQQICKYECAQNRMSAEQLWKVAQALVVQPNYLYDLAEAA
jgi:transcriptional regulator with XRE-family HTH domain